MSVATGTGLDSCISLVCDKYVVVVVVVVVVRRYALGFNIKMKDLNMSDDGTDGTGDDKEIS